MRIIQWQRCSKGAASRTLFLVVCVVVGIAPSALAEGELISRAQSQQAIRDITPLATPSPLIKGGMRGFMSWEGSESIASKKQIGTTTAEGLLVQQPAPTLAPAQITGVQLKPTDKGLEVILETAGTFDEVLTSSAENSLITDIPNAQLRLPGGRAFRQDNPTKDVVLVEVTNLDAKTIRVTVTGKAGIPTAEVSQSPQALILSVAAPPAQPTPTPPATPAPAELQQQAPEAPAPAPQAEEAPVELTVRAEEEAGNYNVPDASTATKFDAPIRDIPASVQVVPQQVLKDRNVRDVNEAVETVSGVVRGDNYQNVTSAPGFIIRGFSQGGNFRNGFRDNNGYSLTGIGTTEQVEVLKGPASVLFGQVEPGGIVNIVTKQPLSEPYYNLAFEAGSYSFFQPSVDLSGPLNGDKTLLYRFIATYQSSGSYQDFANFNLTEIAPSITWKIGDQTDLNLYYEYNRYFADPPQLGTGAFSDGSFFPRNFYPGYPQYSLIDITTHRAGYILEHQLSDNWEIRNNFALITSRTIDEVNGAFELIDDSSITIGGEDRDFTINNYFGQADLLGKFDTGSISHQLLVGFDFNRSGGPYRNSAVSGFPNLDVFNPNYDVPKPEPILSFDSTSLDQSYGTYLQDLISLQDNLKLLVGGRFDWLSGENTDNVTGETTQRPDQSAFSPRIGLVYQPSDIVSLYTSYSQSFVPNFGINPDGQVFQPTRGTQYEVGVKADLLENRLSATLAAYQIAKTNVLTPDPDEQRALLGYQIQVGEQRSRGIELDVAGEILPGWKVTASYAYTNAVVTEDNSIPVGDRFANVPESQAALWTTYELQRGSLKGLGFGLGLFYLGGQPGDLPNTYTIGSYLRTDAALYYRRDGFNAAINIRNLLNTDYDYSPGAGTFIDRAEPFTITSSISWEF